MTPPLFTPPLPNRRSTFWWCMPFYIQKEHPPREPPPKLFTLYTFLCTLPPKPLALGYECERVFPAGVGPGSSSRDAVNCCWLSSRFSRSVETRRWYGWLRMMFTRCTSLSSSNFVPFGRWWHARGRGHCRENPGLSSEYASDSARAGGSSIVAESEEC